MNFFSGCKKSKGFSLIEILITSVILGVGILGVSKFQVGLIKSTSSSSQQIEAVNIARAKMDSMLQFSNAEQYESLVNSHGGKTLINGTSATYDMNWTISENTEKRGADIALTVSWNGESVQTSTFLSNSTPAMLTLSELAPPRPPEDPPEVPPEFPIVNPANPDNAENMCRCDGGVAVAFNSRTDSNQILAKNSRTHRNGFIKVGDDGEGKMEGGWWDSDGDGDDDENRTSKETKQISVTEECNLCCASANIVALKEQTEKYYAQLEEKFIKKARYSGDQVLDPGFFDSGYFIKGYRKNTNNSDIERFLKKTESDWGDDDEKDDSDKKLYTFTALCGINYDPPDPPTVAVPKPKPKPKSTRCIYFKSK